MRPGAWIGWAAAGNAMQAAAAAASKIDIRLVRLRAIPLESFIEGGTGKLQRGSSRRREPSWRTRRNAGPIEPRPLRLPSVAHRAVATRGVDPVALDQVLPGAEGHVVFRPIRKGVFGPEGPRALVGILVAAGVVPGIEVGIGHRFLEFVRDDARH